MALVQGYNGGKIKTQTTIGAAGFTSTNCAKIFQIQADGSGFLVYDPALSVGNQFTTLDVGLVYLFIMKTAGLNIDTYLATGAGGFVFDKLLYYATFAGAASTALSAYTAEKGSLNLGGTGTKLLDGNGNVVITGGGYNSIDPVGTVPANRRVLLEIASLPDTGFDQIILKRKSDGSDFVVVRVQKTGANTVTLKIANATADLQTQTNIPVSYPFKLEARYSNASFLGIIGGGAIGVADATSGFDDLATLNTNTPNSETTSISSLEIEAI